MVIPENYDSKILLQTPLKYDIRQFYLFIFVLNFFPTYWVAIVVKITILIELRGIKIAATTGFKCPVTANVNPIRL